MIKYNKLMIIFLLSAFTACDFNRNTYRTEVDEEELLEDFKTYFTEEPLNSIASVRKDNYLLGITNPSGISLAGGYCRLFYVYKANDENIESTYKEIKKNSKVNFFLTDTSKYYVPSFKKPNNENKIPIIGIADFKDNYYETLINDGTEVYVFNYESGNYFTEKGIKNFFYSRQSDEDTFEGKGYSNGAIINYQSKDILYFTIIW